MHLFWYEAKGAILELKTWPKQLSGSSPLNLVQPVEALSV
jgi:hypothetical protein